MSSESVAEPLGELYSAADAALAIADLAVLDVPHDSIPSPVFGRRGEAIERVPVAFASSDEQDADSLLDGVDAALDAAHLLESLADLPLGSVPSPLGSQLLDSGSSSEEEEDDDEEGESKQSHRRNLLNRTLHKQAEVAWSKATAQAPLEFSSAGPLPEPRRQLPRYQSMAAHAPELYSIVSIDAPRPVHTLPVPSLPRAAPSLPAPDEDESDSDAAALNALSPAQLGVLRRTLNHATTPEAQERARSLLVLVELQQREAAARSRKQEQQRQAARLAALSPSEKRAVNRKTRSAVTLAVYGVDVHSLSPARSPARTTHHHETLVPPRAVARVMEDMAARAASTADSFETAGEGESSGHTTMHEEESKQPGRVTIREEDVASRDKRGAKRRLPDMIPPPMDDDDGTGAVLALEQMLEQQWTAGIDEEEEEEDAGRAEKRRKKSKKKSRSSSRKKERKSKKKSKE
jgi:hypothetical protein